MQTAFCHNHTQVTIIRRRALYERSPSAALNVCAENVEHRRFAGSMHDVRRPGSFLELNLYGGNAGTQAMKSQIKLGTGVLANDCYRLGWGDVVAGTPVFLFLRDAIEVLLY